MTDFRFDLARCLLSSHLRRLRPQPRRLLPSTVAAPSTTTAHSIGLYSVSVFPWLHTQIQRFGRFGRFGRVYSEDLFGFFFFFLFSGFDAGFIRTFASILLVNTNSTNSS
ncbi:hypothetical protein Droror1_Dr00015057 [Drosera rotundifolia]